MKLQLIDGNWFAIETWSTDDVLSRDDGEHNLTMEEAVEVLSLCADYHDCNHGMTWDLIDFNIEKVVSERVRIAHHEGTQNEKP